MIHEEHPPPDLPPDVVDAASLLVLATDEDRKHEVCHDLLTVTVPDGASVLAVSLVGSPVEQLAHWEREDGEWPENLVLMTAGGWGDVDVPAGVRVETVANHRDLPRLGIKVTDVVSDLAADAGAEVALCFDSLTALLQYLEPELVFRFIHTFQSRIAGHNVRVHHHLDPSQVDDEAVMTLRNLFDVVLEVDEDGVDVQQG